MPKIEGPYRHGSMWRCRIKDETGRRWCKAADTPEEARRIAEAGGDGGRQVVDDPPAEATTPSRPASPMRIEGPFAHGRGYRCRVLTGSGPRWCPTRPTRDHAYRMAEQVVSIAMQDGQLSVRQAVEAYLAYQREKGNRAGSVTTAGHVLRRFFASHIDQPIHKITPQRGADLYQKLRTGKGERTGEAISASTHRGNLSQAKTFLSWCVDRGWLRSNPLERVKPIGQKRHGKPQLTINEARLLYGACLREAQRDDGALAVLLALTMGMRAGEVVSRTVRDLDDGGRLLRVTPNEALGFAPKTDKSVRAVPVPQVLQPLLLARTRHKLPGALLLVAEGGGAHWRDWVSEQTRRLCRLAGVPVVCAHSLRGVAATAAVEAGVAVEAVASLLGHESSRMTRQSYIRPGTVEQAEREQTQRVLAGSAMSQSLGHG